MLDIVALLHAPGVRSIIASLGPYGQIQLPVSSMVPGYDAIGGRAASMVVNNNHSDYPGYVTLPFTFGTQAGASVAGFGPSVSVASSVVYLPQVRGLVLDPLATANVPLVPASVPVGTSTFGGVACGVCGCACGWRGGCSLSACIWYSAWLSSVFKCA